MLYYYDESDPSEIRGQSSSAREADKKASTSKVKHKHKATSTKKAPTLKVKQQGDKHKRGDAVKQQGVKRKHGDAVKQHGVKPKHKAEAAVVCKSSQFKEGRKFIQNLKATLKSAIPADPPLALLTI